MCAVLQALEDPTAQLHVSDARAKRDDMAQSSDALRGSASAAGSLAPSPSSEAADRPGVLYAFIVLDTAGANSILEMQTVSFVDGKPVFSQYVDSFPFPLYIVLRDIGARGWRGAPPPPRSGASQGIARACWCCQPRVVVGAA